ncbi:MAG: DUF4340 domain-containing protein [Oscillospiraceae bacterium]|nr:DUF4340 domain-containing protein [Oscillospiraceae bacterium]MCR5306644.1 DUF4340 domain-containing protein [Oscillospiraceae bacterium]
MNKQVKGLLAACGALAVLGGGLAALKLTEKPAEESSVDDHMDPHAGILWELDSSDVISRVDITMPDGRSYAVNRKIEKEEQNNNGSDETTQTEITNYYLEGLEDLPMDTVSIRTLATRSYSASANSVVEEHPTAEDLKKFGLDKATVVKFTADNADPVEFYIGARTPKGEYYLRCKDNETVYAVSGPTVEPFLRDANYYLGKTVTKEQDSEDTVKVKSVRVDRKDLEYSIYLTYDSYYAENDKNGVASLYVMQEPIPCLLNVDRSSGITHGFYGLNAAEVICPHPTEAQLSEYGFDDPFMTATMETDNGKTSVFRLGKTYEPADSTEETPKTYYYGWLDSVNCVYGFAPDDISFDNVTAEDITAKTVVDNYVWDIGSLVYTAGDLKLDFKGMGESKDDYVLKLNGQEADPERFRLLYTYLLNTAAEELVLEEVTPEGEPLVTVDLEQQDGKHNARIAFYDAGSRKAYISVNGRVLYRCRMSYVTTLIENLKIYEDTSKNFTMTW